MAKYRKKPIVIEAIKNDSQLCFTAPHWLVEAMLKPVGAPGRIWVDELGTLTISTLEGDMAASPGDWIIRGVENELYPCSDSVFLATYEPVIDTADARPDR